MRIDNAVRPPYLVHISGGTPAAPAAAKERPPANRVDRVEISPQARELDRLKKELAALPDLRLDQVALARQQMQYGPYRVDPVLVARKMINGQPSRGDDL